MLCITSNWKMTSLGNTTHWINWILWINLNETGKKRLKPDVATCIQWQELTEKRQKHALLDNILLKQNKIGGWPESSGMQEAEIRLRKYATFTIHSSKWKTLVVQSSRIHCGYLCCYKCSRQLWIPGIKCSKELTVTEKTCHISNNNKKILTEIEAASSGMLKSVETDKICTACEEKTVGNWKSKMILTCVFGC